MNNDIDYPVAPAFGESNSRYDERRLTVKGLIIKEKDLMRLWDLLREELGKLTEARIGMRIWLDFLVEERVEALIYTKAAATLNDMDYRSEKIKEKRVKLAEQIKDVRERIKILGG